MNFSNERTVVRLLDKNCDAILIVTHVAHAYSEGSQAKSAGLFPWLFFDIADTMVFLSCRFEINDG